MQNFDEIIDRRGSSCLKYDFAVERGQKADVLPFWVADMDFRAPEAVIDELTRRVRHGIFGYTDAKDDYFAVVAEWFRARHGYFPAKKIFTLTPGVVFAIAMSVRAFTQRGEAVMISPPVYYPFFSTVRENDRKLVESPLVFNGEKYEPDFDDIEKKIVAENVKLFVLCSPHNPVGRVWTRTELMTLAEICVRHNVIVVADEIHHDFVRPGFSHTMFATLNAETEAITVTCTSPSKAFNLAGLQLSNVFIADKKLRRKFRAEISAAGYSQPNALGLFAAKAAYEHGGEWLDALCAYIWENIRFAKNFLAENLPQIKLVEPEGTYLLWLDCSACGLDDKTLGRLIAEKGKLWLDDGHIFGKGGELFERINVACPRETLHEGLKRLAFALGDIEAKK